MANNIKEVEVKVDKIIWRGRGLGSISSGKKVIIIPPCLPGEVIRGEIIRDKKDFVEVRPRVVVKPSPARIKHPCEYSTKCGGCTFGIIDDDYEIFLKKELLKNELTRWLGRYLNFIPEISIITLPKNWNYRWRGQIFVKDNTSHFKEIKNDTLVPFGSCLLFANPINETLQDICKKLPNGKYVVSSSPWNKRVFTNLDVGPLILPYESYGIFLPIYPGSFFQANWELNKKLVDLVVLLSKDFKIIADLFAGCGNFTLPLGVLDKQVIAVENDKNAIVSLNNFIKEKKLSNVVVYEMDLHKKSIHSILKNNKVECLIVDPPRSGGGRFLSQINNIASINRIIWISCDVVNTARDIKPLLESSWKITSLYLFNMFPKTYHMEVVFILDR